MSNGATTTVEGQGLMDRLMGVDANRDHDDLLMRPMGVDRPLSGAKRLRLLLSQTHITAEGGDKSAQGHETWLLLGQPPSSVYATCY